MRQSRSLKNESVYNAFNLLSHLILLNQVLGSLTVNLVLSVSQKLAFIAPSTAAYLMIIRFMAIQIWVTKTILKGGLRGLTVNRSRFLIL